MMNKAPNIYKLQNLISSIKDGPQAGLKDGRWVPARPLGYYGLKHRIKCAWLAFTGKCDLVEWDGGQ